MHYPFWYVPSLTSPMLIALVAVFHVFASQYADAGGSPYASTLRQSLS
ncbi:MAG: hypothetical protein ACE5HA_17170 [Anaerolineae bacterium]